jgi:ribonuclease HI
VIAGLQSLKKESLVIITTDSQYTINGIQKGWAKKWQANNWIRTGSQKAQNWDLWEILLAEIQKHTVTFQWIK